MPSTNGGLPRVLVEALERGKSILPVGLNKKALVPWTPYQTAPPTLDLVESWYAELHPPAWAMVTGQISNVAVGDFDGILGLATAHKYGIQFHVSTPSGGGHEYWQYPGFHVPTISSTTKAALKEILPGLDIRGDGGYVIFCGRNSEGVYKRLRPLSQPDPWAGELVDKLMTIIGEQGTRSASERQPLGGFDRGPSHVEGVSAEEILAAYLEKERNGAARNDNGLQLALQLRDNAISQDEAASVMLRYAAAVKGVNTKGRLEPYTDTEALATVRSAYRRPPREPWGSGSNDRTTGTWSSSVGPAGDPPPTENQKRVGSLIVQQFSEIKLKPVRWLCPGRIARGKVNLIAGNPSLGKSQLMAQMAATVTTGGLWPGEQTHAPLANVIILSAEDDPEDTIGPRLKAAGADMSCVHYIQSVLVGYTGKGDMIQRLFCLEKDLEELAITMNDIGNVALVSLDPISAYLGNTDSHHNAEVRALLAPLSEIAGRHDAAMVIISHLNKNVNAEALMRITGSLAFVAAARTAHLVTLDPEDKDRRLFLPLKNNLGKDIDGLAFKIEGISVEDKGEIIDTSRIVWDSEPVTLSADEAMRAQEPEQRTALREAVEWLEAVLLKPKPTPIPAAELLRKARADGIAEKTLRRAAEKLGVVKKKIGNAGWTWSLGMAHQDGQGRQGGHHFEEGEVAILGVTEIEI